MSSDTPRTDIEDDRGDGLVRAGFARILERDLARLTAENEALKAEIMNALSLAFNWLPNRTVDDARDDLCEQIDLLGRRIAAIKEGS